MVTENRRVAIALTMAMFLRQSTLKANFERFEMTKLVRKV